MKIAVIGAGLMGRAAVYDLARADGVDSVGVFDIDPEMAESVARKFGDGKATSAKLDASDVQAATDALRGFDSAVSCVTYALNIGLTRAAIDAKCHLIDLGGNNDVVASQLAMSDQAASAGVIIIPDCGLAPGMVAVLAVAGIRKFDHVSSLKIRVGGLPQSPRPPLNYQMVFSAEGLINEYWEPCVLLEDGKKKTVHPMTGLELMEFDGIGKLEAFHTSGGISTLPDSLAGQVDSLDYKTIRYPGHCQQFKTILDIGLGSRREVSAGGVEVSPREVLKAVLERTLSFGELDMTLVRLTFEGEKDGASKTVIYEIVDRQQSKDGLTAMMRTTAFPAAIVAWMAADGKIEKRGCYPQELVVNPDIFIPELKRRRINLQITE